MSVLMEKKVKLAISVTEDFRKRVKMLALELGITVQELIYSLLEESMKYK